MVSAYVDNGHGKLINEGSSIINAINKYKDVYQKNAVDDNKNNYLLTINKKGDAVYETSTTGIDGLYAWFNGYSTMPHTFVAWFSRGGDWNSGGSAGAFSFSWYFSCNLLGNNNGCTSIGFRPVLLVNAGL